MPPTINYIIQAFGDSINTLDNTISSISKTGYKSSFISVITSCENVEKLSNVLNSNPSKVEAPAIFNKFPSGIPSFGLAFGAGKIRIADALNTLIKDSYDFSDVFIFLQSGDTITNTYPTKVLDAIDECPGVVGLIYTDIHKDGVRRFIEPFIREKLIESWLPVGFAIPRYVFDRDGVFPLTQNCQNEHLLKIVDEYMAVHLPEPMISR